MPRKATPPHPRSATSVDKSIGSRIRQARIAVDISQPALGEKLGVSFQQVQKYEKGVNRVGAERISQIAKVLKVSTSYLLGENGNNAEFAKQEELNAIDFKIAKELRMLNDMAKGSILNSINYYKRAGWTKANQ